MSIGLQRRLIVFLGDLTKSTQTLSPTRGVRILTHFVTRFTVFCSWICVVFGWDERGEFQRGYHGPVQWPVLGRGSASWDVRDGYWRTEDEKVSHIITRKSRLWRHFVKCSLNESRSCREFPSPQLSPSRLEQVVSIGQPPELKLEVALVWPVLALVYSSLATKPFSYFISSGIALV